MAGSAAAPAARWRKFRRGSFIFEPPFTSLDHLVSAQQERLWDRQAEPLGGREIDDKFESGRLLDRNIAGLRTAQNLVDQLGGAPEQVWEVWSVGHQTARLNKRAGIEDRRQSRAERKRHDASTVGVNE